ncbi:HrgC protein [Fusobacterium pseudoperiodonticum]|uniref:HrgC protein n=1 Tax=Fusobacterium pseudoperiodonticum TaxID=2663009 RepID=A0AAD0ARR4_9FUSO|nr:HrgC protein [Fusobacterium pseudoperiodonticum]ATV66016.1 HrgC protein [Fusobacterium pseudoperiodonticum]ATV71845.1 HrgC protein [Fusobacterium pseudoperiodonticum]
MSVRINLEKDGKKESGFMGFSWTLLFWGFWVPLFRGRNKDFGLFFLFFLVKIGLIVLTFKEQFRAQRNMEMFGFYKPSYILLIPTLIFVIIEVIEVWLAYYYNRYCTNKLLADGYYPEENDEYSIALLKEFTYIPYTKEELEDKSIREKYKKFSDFARKEERDKFKIFFSVWFIIGAIIFIIWVVQYFRFYNF